MSLARPHYLITGGAGFIGSHLVDRLLSEGARVTVLDNLATGTLRNLDGAGRREGFRFVHGSIMDEVVVDELVHQCEVVVHLAAAVGVRLIVDEPLRSFLTNLRGTEVVVDAAHRYRRKILIASTSEIYGKNADQPLHETSDRVIGPTSTTRWSYATSKAVDEILAFLYHRERGLPAIVARLFNTVGRRQRDSYGMVVPRLVRQAVRNEPLTVYGDGSQTRCFCHVSDVLDALIGLLDNEPAVGEAFNIGSEQEISILQLAERIVERSASASTIELIPYDVAFAGRSFEDLDRRVPSTEKIRGLLGWRPTYDLDAILDEVIDEARLEIAEQRPTRQS